MMKNETPCNVLVTQFYHYFAGVSLSLVRVPFLCRNIVMWSCIFLSFNSLNITRYVSKLSHTFNAPLIHEASRTF